MSIRFVPALAAVLTCLTVPAAAQDANSPPALPRRMSPPTGNPP